MVPQMSYVVAVKIQKDLGQTDGVAHSDRPTQDRRP